MSTALKLGNAMWGVSDARWVARKSHFVRREPETAAPPSSAPEPRSQDTRKARKGKAQLHAYTEYSAAREKAWFDKLMDPAQTAEVPKPEQARFLRSVAGRCRYEAGICRQQAAGASQAKASAKPEAFALLAPPGTGKTKCIKLACQYFKEVLGWTHGVEFQCLASQNRMAGRIDGATLHSWGEVPIDRENQNVLDRRTSTKTGGAQMHNKSASLRFLIIDGGKIDRALP